MRPDFAPARAGLARALHALDEHGEARTAARAALALDPDNGEARMVLGILHFQEGEVALGTASLEHALEVSPEDVHVLLSRAFAYALDGDQTHALELVERAVRQDPVSALVQGDAGYFHLWAGNHARAAELCQGALELEPEFQPARDCAMRALDQAGETSAALEHAMVSMRNAGADPSFTESIQRVAGLDPQLALTAYRYWSMERLEERLPNGAAAYSLALLQARQGQTDRSIASLQTAAAAGARWLLTARLDPELKTLHTDRRFVELLEQATA